jgi:hypothetical protein
MLSNVEASKDGVAFDRSSRSTLRLSKGLQCIAPYASVVTPRRPRLQRDFARLNLRVISCWRSGIFQNQLISVMNPELDGGLAHLSDPPSGILHNLPISLLIPNLDGGFGHLPK